jgi:two-component system NtrC family response regulator
MSPEYLAALTLYDWPGNIRELINTLEQSIYVAGDKPTLFSKDLPVKIRVETSLKAAKNKRGI